MLSWKITLFRITSCFVLCVLPAEGNGDEEKEGLETDKFDILNSNVHTRVICFELLYNVISIQFI